jgi:hypothetical protein
MNWHADAWQQYQHAQLKNCLQGINVSDDWRVEPLYPGSMLFNQIAVIDHPQATDLHLYRPQLESLDSIYEAIGASDAEVADEPCLLIDCQCSIAERDRQHLKQSLLIELKMFIDKRNQHGRVVLVDSVHVDHLKQLCDSVALRYQVIRPRWWQASQWLRWYRSAERCVFVDSARVLDAAMTGVPCHSLATRTYVAKPVYPALHAALVGYDHCRVTSVFAGETGDSLKVIENDIAQLSTAMGYDCGDRVAGSSVISAESLWQNKWRSKLGNVQVSTRRKSRKLIEDPRAFFRDSKLPGTDGIAVLFRDSTSRISSPRG